MPSHAPISAAPASETARGVALMAAGSLTIPIMDILAKLLGETISPLHIVFWRLTFQGLFMAAFVIWLGGLRGLRTQRMGLQALRGALLAGATVCFFTALKFMPIANAIAIFFVEPLIVTLIATTFLGERVGWRRMSAVLAGLIGAMIVIRPSFADVGWPALLPLCTAVFFSIYLLITRTLTTDCGVAATQAYTGLWGAATAGVAVLIAWALGVPDTAPKLFSTAEWGMLGVMGAVSIVGNALITTAFRHASAAVLAPVQYIEIFSATLLGWMVFGYFPDTLTWLGVTIIVGAGLVVYWRERKAHGVNDAL